MTDLGKDARELLAQARDEDDPSADDRERIRRKLAVALAVSSVATSSVATTAAVAKAGTGPVASAAGASILSGKLVLATVVVVASGAAVVVQQTRQPDVDSTPRPAAQVRARAAAEHAEPAKARTVPARADTPAPAAADDGMEGSAAHPARQGADTTSMDEHIPSLRAELDLIAAAQSALSQGEPARALARIDEHAVRFPRGAFVQERLAIIAVASCTLGDRARGQAAAVQLARRAPSSPLLARARSACRGREPTAE